MGSPLTLTEGLMLKKQQVLRLDDPSQIEIVRQSLSIPVHTQLVQLLVRLIGRSAMSAETQKEKSHDARDE